MALFYTGCHMAAWRSSLWEFWWLERGLIIILECPARRPQGTYVQVFLRWKETS